MNSQPFTAAYHNTLMNDIPGNSSVSSVMPGYPENVLSGGKKRSNGKRSSRKKRSKRSSRKKRSRSSRRNPEEKVVRGARFQSRPSASHYYNTLNHPVGYKISYRPRKGGKYIMHELALRKNGTPFWKALEKLPKRSKKSRKGRKSKRSRTTRRNSRGQQVRTRRARYLDRRGYGGAAAAGRAWTGATRFMRQIPSPRAPRGLHGAVDSAAEAASEVGESVMLEHVQDDAAATGALARWLGSFKRNHKMHKQPQALVIPRTALGKGHSGTPAGLRSIVGSPVAP